ncbi:MAG: response regulator [Candidatus Scalindua sediminis]|nr:response regulator [Candidatus Scalindua sediminis]
MYNDTEKRKHEIMGLEKRKCFARFRVKQYEDQEMSSPDWDTVAVKNLSAGGMLFHYHKNLEIDSLMDLTIDISEYIPTINCVGRVIRIEEFQSLSTQDVQPLTSMCRIATEFTEIGKQERETINIAVGETKGKNLNLKKLRAIVLDDDYILRTLINDILKNRGYEVHSSSEPFFCPVYLDSKCPCPVEHFCSNIIITDINMPNMTGFEFIENLKRNACKIQNVAIMSGRWTDEELEHAKRLGCHTFEKPFKIDEFGKWLDDCEKKLDPDNKLSDLPIRMIKSKKNK